MDQPPETRAITQRRSGRDRTIAVSIAVICVALLAGLWAISRNTPASVQQDSVSLITEGVSGEDGCSSFSGFWTTGSGVNVPIDAIESLTNCRLSDDGTWFVPTGADDPRLSTRSIPTVEHLTATEVMSAQLHEDLSALEAQLPDSLKESLTANYDETNQPVFGHTKRGRTDLTVKRNRYSRITQAFLIDPNRAVIADYVGWVMSRRALAADAFEASCRADSDLGFILRACVGMRNEFGVSQIPLYWDLNDPVLINEYLIARSTEPLTAPGSTPDSTT